MISILNIFLCALPARQIRYHNTIWNTDFIRMRKQRIYGEKPKPKSKDDIVVKSISTILSEITDENSGNKIDWKYIFNFTSESLFIIVLSVLTNMDAIMVSYYEPFNDSNSTVSVDFVNEYIDLYIPFYKCIYTSIISFVMLVATYIIYRKGRWRRSNSKFTAAGLFYCENSLFRAVLLLSSSTLFSLLFFGRYEKTAWWLLALGLDSSLAFFVTIGMVCSKKEFWRIFLHDYKKKKKRKNIYLD